MPDNKNSDPAFPQTGRKDIDGFWVGQAPGLTKRELFAAMAMQGMLASSSTCEAIAKAGGTSDWFNAILAVRAVASADALLEALAK